MGLRNSERLTTESCTQAHDSAVSRSSWSPESVSGGRPKESVSGDQLKESILSDRTDLVNEQKDVLRMF